MFRLLIVDDEKNIADSLFNIINALNNPELDICKAYSGAEAIEILNIAVVNIILLDINMPGINGIELMEYIRNKSPDSRIIFLTGFNDFSYIYNITRNTPTHYLLKTESIETIIKTIYDVLEEIKKSLYLREEVEKSKEDMKKAADIIAKDSLRALITGEESGDADILNKQLLLLSPDFDCSKPYYLLLGRIDSFYSLDLSYSERLGLLYSIDMISNKIPTYIKSSKASIYDNANILWLMQFDIDDTEVFFNGIIDMLQKSCSMSLDITISFAYKNKPVEVPMLPKEYLFLKSTLNYTASSQCSVVLNLDDQEEYVDSKEQQNISQIALRGIHSTKLSALLENGDDKGYFIELHTIIKSFNQTIRMDFLPAIQIYYSISNILLSYIIRHNLNEKQIISAFLHKLIHIDIHRNWNEAFTYLETVSIAIFDIIRTDNEQSTNSIIMRTKEYINQNLANDLTLVTIANNMHYNPSYLSYVFKQISGINISEYVNECRISKAKHLLTNTNMKIADIALAVGYESPNNFARFFRSITGIPPTQFRHN